jgi:hypothetical protein
MLEIAEPVNNYLEAVMRYFIVSWTVAFTITSAFLLLVEQAELLAIHRGFL